MTPTAFHEWNASRRKDCNIGQTEPVKKEVPPTRPKLVFGQPIPKAAAKAKARQPKRV